MTYKLFKGLFHYDYRKEAELIYRKTPPAPAVNRLPADYDMRDREREVRVIENGETGLTQEDLAMITESVLSALKRERLREERRKGR